MTESKRCYPIILPEASIEISKHMGFSHTFNGDYEDPDWFWIPPDNPDGEIDDLPVTISIQADMTMAQFEAIENLISAAPEMLKALKMARKFMLGVEYNDLKPNEATNTYNVIDAVITKIEGKKK
jgi:hypothetical protein